ncbi:ATP-binding protein [Sphingomonas morindae]|uniref:histidine kinase n=1 Tax=Sphingomonas morindae TaxID=1541170 RepID=A0ABY4X3G6_9SPHN|nr:ATP-binding protein [Sphingomonas morindae]USI71438.1 GAF domain-containing protein [Sphingomonas morindae]
MATSLAGTIKSGADLEACAREPIHIPGAIQPHGALLALDPATLAVMQAACGPGLGLFDAQAAIGRPVAEILPAPLRPLLAPIGAVTTPQYLGMARLPHSARGLHAIAHRAGDALILELEEGIEEEPTEFYHIYPALQAFLGALEAAGTIEELGTLAAREVRRITGFDRVLVYRFDPEWNGTVIAEDGNDRLPSYLGLRFPAGDIPAQARELYRLNRLRLIADADYVPVPILPAGHPATGAPLDLSQSVLRSVSPVHLEYMRNMGTGASMSISLLRDGALWGLISCHNRAPHRVPYHVRTACDFLGQILSLQLVAKERGALAERRIALRAVESQLLARMAAEEQFLDGLVAAPDDLLGLTHAAGAAVVSAGQCRTVGVTPSEDAIARITAWLDARPVEDLFATESLVGEMPGAEALKDSACGLVAISISQLHSSYVLWFRPELVRTVRWGGSPLKPGEVPEGARIHPRKSFEAWKETVRERSAPWDEAELDAAAQLRSAIVEIVLRRAEELAQLNEQLLRSNKELEAFSYSVSHDLRAPFRHIVGYSQLLRQNEADKISERGQRFIDTIIESAVSAGTLVDDLLSFSQMGRATLHPRRIDIGQLVAEVRAQLAPDMAGRAIEWRVGALPAIVADPTMLRLVFQNLLDNAIKFTRGRSPAVIEIGHRAGEGEAIFFVRDNGAGFDMAYVSKLFGVFQRLHRAEEFEGTGIGLANVKRIVEQRHGGRVWAEGAVDQGATLYFALPVGANG